MRKMLSVVLVIGALAFAGSLFLPISSVSAAPCSNTSPLPGFRSWKAGLTCTGANDEEALMWSAGKNDQSVANEMNKIIWTIALNLIASISALVGYICIGMIIFAGYQYMSAGGSAGKLESAKKTLYRAVIGLIICILARTITEIFLNLAVKAVA